MLTEKIEYVIRKYSFEVSEEINEITKILRTGRNFTDLLDGETFYKGLWNRMLRIKLTGGFDAIISHELIPEEKSKKLHSLRERSQSNYFEYIELLFFAFENKVSITPEALNQLQIRFKHVYEPLEKIHKLFAEIIEDLPEDVELFDDDSDMWEDFS